MIYACHTWYSLLYGTLKVETVVELASRMGIETLVITDINNTTGCLDFFKECHDNRIKAVCGTECRKGDQYLYTCIARNNEGFREINEFLSEYTALSLPLPVQAPEFSQVYVVYPSGVKSFHSLRINEFVGVRPCDINKTYIQQYRQFKDKLVALLPVTFAAREDHALHCHLRAIDQNTLLTMLDPVTLAREDEQLVAPDFVRILYEDIPECLRNAERLLDNCSFHFDFQQRKNKLLYGNSPYEDMLLLERLALEGMQYRYGSNNAEALKRVRKELKMIGELGFCSYFLITWDIIHYTLSKDIYHVGRGSGGNSIVAYCLKITDIDPIELNLYFERFINPHRTSPPDFDIDYSWKDRDLVYDYIFKRYPKYQVALLGAMNTFHDSSIIRELGKVYGLPKRDIDDLVDRPHSTLLQNDITQKIFDYGSLLMDFPHHRSIHAGGVIIAEESLCYYTALDMPPKGLPTTQWDMYVAEAIGFEKLDILRNQRGLGHIRECADIVYQNRGIEVDVHRVEEFKSDPEVNKRLYDGEAIGCFYIESPAMRGLLKKLRCNNYLSLVAASSMIRPGVAKSGMMREYIKRFHHQQAINYLHPIFEQHMKETYGVMVYQEDVIKVAHYFAGMDLADADILRRAMSGKFRSKKEFARISEVYFSNCRQRGYPEALISEVWRQISSFAGYAFCKAHSASYAVESYQSLYLKTYFPHEFHVAVINNFGGFYRTWVYVNEARRNGAGIHLPDINVSEYTACIRGTDIFLGWVHVKGLESNVANRICEERQTNGVFRDFYDFTERVPVPMEQLMLLIKSGAFRFTGKTKKELMWSQLMRSRGEPVSRPLFEEARREFVLPELRSDILEDAYDEMELLGFPVSMTHFDMLQTRYQGNTLSGDLSSKCGKTVRMVGDLVAIKYVFTVKKEVMHFGSFLDRQGAFFDTVHFPDSLKKYPFTGYGVYLLEGKVVAEFDYPSIEVHKMARLPYQPDPRLD